MSVIENFECTGQHYIRTAPILFEKARGAEVFDQAGKRYIDFNAAGGLLFYGHNDVTVCSAVIDHLCSEKVLQFREKITTAKRLFIHNFFEKILINRDPNYRILFTEPASGTSVEIALRLARRNKKRSTIIAFTNSTHGITEGALSVSSRRTPSYDSLYPRTNVVFMPYGGYFGDDVDTLPYIRRHLEDLGSGIGEVAAIIVETVQIDGGVRVAPIEWLKGIEQLCREFGLLLIVDESQSGCGRASHHYFSFERAGLKPDIILLSNAMAAGFPFSAMLLRPELDQWQAGEHVGVFQANGLAFAAATELISLWNDEFVAAAQRNSETISSALGLLTQRNSGLPLMVRGTGMIWGLDVGRPGAATVLSAWALEQGLIAEACRYKDSVLLIAPPITIEEPVLLEGLERLATTVSMLLDHGRTLRS